MVIVVAKDGTGDFTLIQEAVDSIPEDHSGHSTIYIKEGIYQEKLVITKSKLSLIGEAGKRVVISYGDYARKPLPNGKKMGTFASYTVLIACNQFVANNIVFENSAGPGSKVGQAVAVYADGDELEFHHCTFLGSQDTLFTGPLPPKPIEGDRFGGPRDGMERKVGRSYFKHCYIEGDVDFIFGSATSVFHQCEIHSLNRYSNPNGFITAASTPEGEEYGYVFIDCRLTSTADANTVYLGRPWRDFAKTAFIHCWMDKHIKAEGWHNWEKSHVESTTLYVEFDSYGPGGNMEKREKWSKILSKEEVEKYQLKHIFHVDDNWDGWDQQRRKEIEE